MLDPEQMIAERIVSARQIQAEIHHMISTREAMQEDDDLTFVTDIRISDHIRKLNKRLAEIQGTDTPRATIEKSISISPESGEVTEVRVTQVLQKAGIHYEELKELRAQATAELEVIPNG